MAKKHKDFFRTIFWLLALCAWCYISLEASAYFTSFILNLCLTKAQLTSPLWTTIYNALAYTLALIVMIFVPYLVISKGKSRRAALRSTQKSKKTKLKQNSDAAKTELTRAPSATDSKPVSTEHKPIFAELDALGEKPTCAELGLQGLPTWTDILLAPIGFFVYFILAALLTWAFSFLPWFDASKAQDVGYSYTLFGSDLVVAFIALVVIAPIAEEIIFRGWLYGKLRTRLNIPVAVVATSVLFAFLHGQWNVAVNVFALSLVLCALREITGTIYAGIILHMLKNGIAFYLVYIAHLT